MDQEFWKNSNLEAELARAKAMLDTPAGQALLAALGRDGGKALADAGKRLRASDPEGAISALEKVLTPQERATLDRASENAPWKI